MNAQTDPLPKTPPGDSLNVRCPRLGHQINFSYCRVENNGLPCFKTLDCWHHFFDVHTYLKEALTKEEFDKVFIQTGAPKIKSLLDLIEQAKKSQKSKSEGEKD